MYSERGLFIDSAWRPKGRGGESPVTDPSSGELLGFAPADSADDTAEPIVAASRAFPVWAATQAWTPADILTLAEKNFGPIAAIPPFATDEEASRRANDSPYGLSAYAFTRSAARAREAVARIQSGMVGINSFALAAAEAPFGGVRYSGMGREGGTEGMTDYCNVKLAQVTLP